MGKTHTTITLDQDIVNMAKRQGINISQTAEQALISLLNIQTKDLEGINIEIKRKELIKLEKEAEEKNIEIKKIREIIRLYEDKQEETKMQELEAEKKAAEEAKHCKSCGKLLVEGMKRHKFLIGNICNPCFMMSDREQVKKWNMKEEK